MKRVDIAKTIEQISFSPEVWEWLDLMGTIVGESQSEAKTRERGFIADTPYKKFLLCTINKDLQTIAAIYLLLRCEMIHQAASHVRLLCESLINMRYVSLDPERRAELFWGYMDIDAYKIAEALLEYEGSKAEPSHVERLIKFKDSIEDSYHKKREVYSNEDKKVPGRRRPFRNWCNKTMPTLAQECGQNMRRLYDLVYKQMSSYIHGSAWSLRRQVSYSGDHYQADVVLNDIASITQTTLVVWVEWAMFCCQDLGWDLYEIIRWIPGKLNELEKKHFPY